MKINRVRQAMALNRRCDNDCGKHEGNSSQGAQERFAAKIIACKKIGGRKPEQESEKSGKDCLVESET